MIAITAKAFVPARNFEVSRRFYEALGFTQEWANTELAYFTHGTACFFLRNGSPPGLAENFLMHLLVDDADAWYEQARMACADFGLTPEAPANRPWGTRDFLVPDPSGVHWRITQPL